MGDIDISVLPEDFERACQALTDAGIRPEKTNDVHRRHHKFSDARGYEIEVHRYFAASHDSEANAFVDNAIYDGIRNRETVMIEGIATPVLPKLANGIVLMSHINMHLTHGLGLRHIMDWMMYVRTCLDNRFWKEEFGPAAKKAGLYKLTLTVTAMCRKYLGLPEEYSWCEGADESLCDELMDYILSRGNFGMADSAGENGSINTFIRFRSLPVMAEYLQSGGILHWKAAREHSWLRPFAWIYQIGHLAKKALTNKVGLSTMVRSSSKARSTTELMRKLEVTNI